MRFPERSVPTENVYVYRVGGPTTLARRASEGAARPSRCFVWTVYSVIHMSLVTWTLRRVNPHSAAFPVLHPRKFASGAAFHR